MERRKAKLSEICSQVGVRYTGEDVEIDALNLCNRQTQYKAILGYVTSEKFFEAICCNKAIKALIMTEEMLQSFTSHMASSSRKFAYILSPKPEFLFYDIHNFLWERTDFYDHYKKEPQIGHNCNIHPSAVIENGTIIGNNVEIGPNSVIRSGAVIEDNVVIGCCTVIGSEGFQAIVGYDKMIKHVGGTYICHDVSVGDCTTIGNALFEGETRIGPYTRISNHVHISHNCLCGAHCFITTNVTLMGSTVVDDNVWLAPGAMTLNRVHIHDDAFVGAYSFVNKEVSEGDIVMGIPAKILRKRYQG